MNSGYLIIAVVGIFTATLILWLVRRDYLHIRYALWWIFIAIVIGGLGMFPPLVDWMGAKLGIYYPPILPLLVAIMLLTIKILLMDIERSKSEVNLSCLIQRVAILEARINQVADKGSDKDC